MRTEVVAAQTGWVVQRYPLGDGLATVAAEVLYELIPYADPDGSGQVAGYVVRMNRPTLGLLPRFPGPIRRAREAAEAWIEAARLTPPAPP